MIKSKKLPKYKSLPQYGLNMDTGNQQNVKFNPSIIKKLSKFLKGKKIMVAGGYFTGTETSDIDLFAYDMKNGEYEKLIRDFADYYNVDFKICYNCLNTNVFGHEIQIISIIHDTKRAILADFDIDACQIGFDFYTQYYIYTPEAEKALSTWTIVFNPRKFYEKTASRYYKYVCSKGFSLWWAEYRPQYQLYIIYDMTIFASDGKIQNIKIDNTRKPKYPMFKMGESRKLSKTGKIPIRYKYDTGQFAVEKMKVITI